MTANNLPVAPRILRVGTVFTPATPITDADLFSGRQDLLIRIADAVNQRGMHCILFGERGVGKTSLANILPEVVSQAIPGEMAVASVNCDSADDYGSLMHKLMQEIITVQELPNLGFGGSSTRLEIPMSDRLPEQPTPNDIRILMQTFPTNWLLIVDEFDRIADQNSMRLVSDTIKTLSDRAVSATMVLVGVAANVDELLSEHQSIERCLTQVSMPRMTHDELATIVDKGLAQVDMRVDESARWYIPTVSQGYPHYTHLLALNAARQALEENRDVVTRADIEATIDAAIAPRGHSIASGYLRATYSPHPSALYEPVLLACALAETDDLNYFNAQAVREPLSRIMGRTYDVPAFARHLDSFCEDSRGPALIKEGQIRSYRYRFALPLMRPYILLKGIADNRISAEDIT